MIFQPQLLETLKNYNREQFLKDLMAGIIVGVVALPLGIAFGIASGVSPEKGIFTCIIAGFIISFFGGSKVQIGGPTGAFIVIVSGVVQEFGVAGLAVATIMAGLMLIGMGLLRMGSIIKFIPFPVVVGLNSGIAFSIFNTQIKDLFGLQIDSMPTNFIGKWAAYFDNFGTFSLLTLGLSLLSIAIIVFTPRFNKKIPGHLMAIVVMTIISFVLRNNFGISGIETIGDRFSINAALPQPETPEITFDIIRMLFPTAFTLAMFGAIVSLLSATVADGVTGDKHRPDTELIAQGIANVITPLFGGIPATGAIARTMTNINNGGRTPIAGIIHAVVLLLIMMFLGNLTQHIPMACLAGVLVIVSYNMSEWRSFKSLMRNPKSDVAVLLVTFGLTVIFDLTIAIQVGLLLAVVLFIRRISATSNISIFKESVSQADYVEGSEDTHKLLIPKGVEIYEIEGPFFFGLANKFEETMIEVGDKPKVRIIRMRKVPFIDSTGIHNLESLIRMSTKNKTRILLSGVNAEVRQMLQQTGIETRLGADNVCDNIDIALERAKKIIAQPPSPLKGELELEN